MLLHGLDIVSTPYAVQVAYLVQRHPIRKRRRNWRVVRVTQPGCWRAGNTLYMHPDLVQRLREVAR